MTRYYFHLHNDIDSPDEEGQELNDDRAALETALDAAREMASEQVRLESLDLRHFIVCVDEAGREVGIVRFGDAVKLSQ
ncbi:MAG: hypothetical protein EOP94_00730 [Zymomonas sp.]|nr:MAG: hypothetical protein EOP94_00730 [Zymomonas sp.]